MEGRVKASVNIVVESRLHNLAAWFYVFQDGNIYGESLSTRVSIYINLVYLPYLILKYLSVESFTLVSERERTLTRVRFTIKYFRCLECIYIKSSWNLRSITLLSSLKHSCMFLKTHGINLFSFFKYKILLEMNH